MHLPLSTSSQNERLTVLALKGSFVDDLGHNILWSLAFAVHCILSAVFGVQGALQVSYLARRAFYSSMNQLCSEESQTMSAPRHSAVSRERASSLYTNFFCRQSRKRRELGTKNCSRFGIRTVQEHSYRLFPSWLGGCGHV
jgi:hypothetical protein